MAVFRRTAAIAVVLSGFFVGDAAPAPYRYRWCEKRIHEAKGNLTRTIRRYGEDSREADYRRHVLLELREKCTNYSRGGNEERREWQEYEKQTERERRD